MKQSGKKELDFPRMNKSSDWTPCRAGFQSPGQVCCSSPEDLKMACMSVMEM